MNGDDRNDELETRVSDALGAYASAIEPSPDALDRIRDGRPNRFVSRGPVLAAAAALVVVVAIGAGVALSSDDEGLDVGVDPPDATSTSTTDAPTTTTAAPTTTTVPPTTVPPTAPPTTVATNSSIFDDGVLATAFAPLEGAQWQAIMDAVNTGFGSESPQAAGEAVAARTIAEVSGDVPIEIRVNVRQQSTLDAIVEITYRRWPDDSVSGVDQELAVQMGEAGWFVVSGRSRSLCSRGLDSAQNLCV
ncbi:MAG TPA: hypothetical protein VFZ83_01930 [Acidimicrobiia bacterium]|nr:hypothetical protein [Acidimicrobiia bacterium]